MRRRRSDAPTIDRVRAHSLDRRLQRIVAASLAAACGSSVATACGEAEPSRSTPSQLENACTGTSFSMVGGFTPGTPVDWLAFRNEHATAPAAPPDAGDASAPPSTVSSGEERGAPCSGATNREACLQQLAAIRVVKDCKSIFGCSATYLVFTRGDEIGVLTTNEEVTRFLLPIDTKEEAFYVANRSDPGRLQVRCNAEPQAKYFVHPNGDGVDVTFTVHRSCPEGTLDELVVHVSADGTVTEKERHPLGGIEPCGSDATGRRPAGLRRAVAETTSELGAFFAHAAHLEAASVVAFERLHDELRRLAAPQKMLCAVLRARRDEIRHARTMTRLARRFGATPPKVRVDRARERSIVAIAIENVREGCVRETFGAALALRRATTVEDAEIRETMRTIAVDELRHAQLSWDVAAFLHTKLTDRERAMVRRRLDREIASVAAESASDPVARDLFERIEREVWRTSA